MRPRLLHTTRVSVQQPRRQTFRMPAPVRPARGENSSLNERSRLESFATASPLEQRCHSRVAVSMAIRPPGVWRLTKRIRGSRLTSFINFLLSDSRRRARHLQDLEAGAALFRDGALGPLHP